MSDWQGGTLEIGHRASDIGVASGKFLPDGGPKFFFGRNWSKWVEIGRNGVGTTEARRHRGRRKIFLFWLNELVLTFTDFNAAFTRTAADHAQEEAERAESPGQRRLEV